MTKGAVIGFPITHSLSPQIFSFLSKRFNSGGFIYDALEVKPENLSQFVKEHKSKLIGMNVTIPHKENILKELDQLSPEAKGVGAVNCVHFRNEAGNVISYGHNTDVGGFTDSVLEKKINLEGKTSLILGAGGAARAVGYSLGNLKCSDVLILNKTISRGEKLAFDLRALFPKTKFTALEKFGKSKSVSFVINATPLGMKNYGSLSEAEIFFADVFQEITSKNVFVFDLIYTPKETPFLKMAEKRGFSIVGGLDMLVYQALRSWEIWFKPLQNKDEIKGDLVAELTKSEKVFLTGFMGAGKSTVAKIMATKLGWTLVDVDKEIEARAGKSVSEVFEKSGEDAFRALESKIIQETCGRSQIVVALGGGALLNINNLRVIKTKGTLLYLSATKQKLEERLKNSAASRPLLRHDKSLTLSEHIGNLMKVRESQYKEANFEIVTDHMTDVEVAMEAINKIKAKSK